MTRCWPRSSPTAPDRATALDRLDRALASFAIAGVTTNAAFTRALLARADVRAGEQDTGLLERVLAERARAAARGSRRPRRCSPPPARATPAGPWRRALDEHGEARVGDGTRDASASARGRCDAARRRRLAASSSSRSTASSAATPSPSSDDAVWIARDGHHLEVRTERHVRGGAGAARGSLEAPMPGTVWLVNVANGDTVAEGDVLLVLESMKMELSITAPYAGTVAGLALAGRRPRRAQAAAASRSSPRRPA